jgi:phosphoribosyl-AMP cyclohydrolase
MRVAHVGVIPGTVSSSATLAWFTSTRSAAAGAAVAVFVAGKLTPPELTAHEDAVNPAHSIATAAILCPVRIASFCAQSRRAASRPVDTPPARTLGFQSDAERPPPRPSPPSWKLHAGGLPWPDVNGQRDQKDKARRPLTGGLFAVSNKTNQIRMKMSDQSNQTDKAEIDFAKMDGLVPGIVQDAHTGEVLMLGFLNELSYARTLESGFVTFWSRTRQKLWMKGETSGNRLRIVTASIDCDTDTLLFRVEVEGDGLVCHEGTVSCFTRPVELAETTAEPNLKKEELRG